MYEEFYGFREKPFNLAPDPSFLYLSPKHRMALTYLDYALMDGIGFVLLTGEIGAGKTTIIRKLLTQLEPDLEVAVVFNTNVSSEQLLELILQEFELESPKRRKTTYLDILNEFLVSKYSQGQRVVLIVDEAQNLSHETLEEIRMISNLQSDKDTLLQIVLAGQPGLQTKLRHPSLAQLRQRIAVSYHLAPLSLAETGEYIAHRLQQAGGQNDTLFMPEAVEKVFHHSGSISRTINLQQAGGQNDTLFAPEAVEKVFHHSGGIPRTINIICDAALVYGYADELPTIDSQVIEHVLRDKQESGLFPVGSTVEENEFPSEAFPNNGDMLPRLQRLEERVARLSAILDGQVEDYERRAEDYKDRLVHKLEGMLVEERKRNDELMFKYGQIMDKLNSVPRNSTQ